MVMKRVITYDRSDEYGGDNQAKRFVDVHSNYFERIDSNGSQYSKLPRILSYIGSKG